jgi:type II secretory pathway pseudopilin PulG
MMKSRTKSGGYSLIETLISLGLMTLLLLVIVESAFVVSKSHQRTRTFLDINATALGAFSRFSRDIRRATSVDTVNSTLGASSGKLVLKMKRDDGTYDSTTFYLDGDRVKEKFNGIDRGGITQANMSVSNLTFRQLTLGTTTAIRVEMTLAPDASTTISALNFYGTYVLRGSYAQ